MQSSAILESVLKNAQIHTHLGMLLEDALLVMMLVENALGLAKRNAITVLLDIMK